MCISGLGPTQIAKRLKADGVLTPSEYQRSIGVNCPTKLPEYPHKWCSHTVTEILDRQEYVGDTVNSAPITSLSSRKAVRQAPG